MPFNQFTPRNFTSDSVKMHAPVTSGVYGISNAREWIYIGESNNIQNSLMTHLQDLQASIGKHGPTGFVFEVCDEAHRSARLDRLVREYDPACNRQPLERW
jgi:hypothetical protein